MAQRMTSLGFAQEEPAAAPLDFSGATIPALGGAGETRNARKPLIDFAQNPLGAIGAVLMNVARGASGQPLYTDELLEREQQEQLLGYKKMELGAQALTKGIELLKNTPAANRDRVAKQFGALYEPIVGAGFTQTLLDASAQPDTTAAIIQRFGKRGQEMYKLAGGDPDLTLDLLQDDKLQTRLDEMDGRRLGKEAMRRIAAAGEVLEQSPEGQQALQSLQQGWTLADLQDPAIMEVMGLTPEHVDAIARSPELQSQLRPFGFVPTADLDLQAKEAITDPQKSLSQISAEAGAKATAEATAKASAKPMNYIGPDGTIRAGTFGEREQMAAQGFQPLVTGRTPDDAAAAERDKLQTTIPPFVASLAGVDPGTTKADFRAAGGNDEIDATTTRALQGAEAAVKGTRDIIGNMRAIVQENPDANTRVAALQGVATNLIAEFKALTGALGADVDLNAEVAKHEDTFKKNGIDNALMKQGAIVLAYMSAKAMDEGGRLTDRDVNLAAQAMGTGAADPQMLLALLDQAEVNADSTFRNRVEAAIRKRPPSQLPDVREAEAVAERLMADEDVSREELAKLSPRARRLLKSRLANAVK